VWFYKNTFMRQTTKHNRSAGMTGEPKDLIPLNIIRTETVFSKFPIHTLSKKGRIDIHLIRKTDAGETNLEWKVSPHQEFGVPRQLAYKLDTLVVNRTIDELDRPLPEVIRLGSLRDICKELGLKESGRTTDQIKKAFFQNAHTVITAKLDYKGRDGVKRRVAESNNKLISFTRYSLAFTGATLPNGQKADAVYLILNPPYREVLNNAPVRPLNYDYLKQLTPGPQRFYELISRQLFAAIKYNLPSAKLSYSEYCRHAPQQRYFDYEHFKKQMYKIHRPHLQSGYLEKVSFETTTCSEGNRDWLMLYTPGPKAKAEFKTFNSKQLIGNTIVPEPVPENDGGNGSETPLRSQAEELLRYFHQRVRGQEGYTAPVRSRERDLALELLELYGAEKANFIVDFAADQAKTTRFQMRTFGALIQYVNEALDAWRQREQAREQNRLQETADNNLHQRETDIMQMRIAQLDAFHRDSPEAYQTLFEQEKAKLIRWLPMAAKWDLKDLETTVRGGMLRELERGQQGQPPASV
jgi:hypothetical protein